ncbi:S1 family peptidase [Zhihengliuella salsuginis]|uniref:Gram-positive cocci surface proteins LPxTG domain-containing protein n=1 Tax=Zhihengliuella salsuginis TaxID=578222 RepID=A0ABQ3GC45_9MICC|nr:S1 family peptidase [Zhihengliuella salsuginis]GHD00028.1 hypothetical protein GCM10008096_02800 [Zhihengliuella salsuginis]
MHASRNTWKRASAACAATALVLGAAFTAAPAGAVVLEDSKGVSAPSDHDPGVTPELVQISPEAGDGAALPDPEGLEDAVERDLGKSLDAFLAAGDLVKVASTLKAQLAEQDLTAAIVVEGGGLLALTGADQVEAVEVALAETTADLDVVVEVKSAEQAADAAGAEPEPVETESADAEPSDAETAEDDAAEVDAEAAEAAQQASAADSVESLLAAYTADFGLENLQSVTTDGSRFVIRTGDDASGPAEMSAKETDGSEGPSLQDFVEQYTNVATETATGPAEPFAADDLVGGMPYGWSSDGGTTWDVCSTGFTGFDADGNDAVVSAGHCTQDGDIVGPLQLLDQQGEPDTLQDVAQELGSFGFSQFGGTGNTPSSQPEPDNVGTDISVIDDINPQLNPLPMVSDWMTAPDITEAGPSVTDVAEPVVGADVCKSGRTTGWTCAQVDETGVFFVGGHNYVEDENDVRAVAGFVSEGLESAQGDSGGSMVSGSVAIGVLSAGSDGTTFGTGLVDALGYTDGYTVRIHLEAPEITSVDDAGDVESGGDISGVVDGAASGTEIVLRSTGQAPVAYPVGDDGTFTFPAPDEEGAYRFSVQARNGFSTSAMTAHSVVVVPAPATPTPTPTPTDEPSVTPTPTQTPTSSPSPTDEPTESALPTEKPAASPTPSDDPGTAAPAPEPTEDDDAGAGRLPDTGASNGLKAAASVGASMAVVGALLLLLRRPARRH